jgi:hypothetical protein
VRRRRTGLAWRTLWAPVCRSVLVPALGLARGAAVPHHTVPSVRPRPHAGFLQTVVASCLGRAYVTANQVPNLVYELILDGALTSAMVPVLGRSAERASADDDEKRGSATSPQSY